MTDNNRRIRYASLDTTPRAYATAVPSASSGTVSSVLPPYGDTRVLCSANDAGSRGRCFWAPDGCSGIAVLLFLSLFTGLFAYVWLSDASDHGQLSLSAASGSGGSGGSSSSMMWVIAVMGQGALTLSTVFVMLVTMFADPGILEKRCGLPSQQPTADAVPHIRGEPCEVIDGVLVLRPYCHTCNLQRPLRAAHCATCNNCVERFDHHCGLIGACIGKGNFSYFLRFLVVLIFCSGWMAGFSMVLAVRIFSDGGRVWRGATCVLIALVSGITLGAIVLMYAYYVRIMLKGRTHRENLKFDLLFSPAGAKSPFDKGPMANCGELCC